jgi:hypothetical protein
MKGILAHHLRATLVPGIELSQWESHVICPNHDIITFPFLHNTSQLLPNSTIIKSISLEEHAQGWCVGVYLKSSVFECAGVCRA